MKSRYFEECAEHDESTKLTLPFGRLRYYGGEVQNCAWKFILPEDNRDYVFLMQIPYFSIENKNNAVTLPNNGKNTFIFFRIYIKLFADLMAH